MAGCALCGGMLKLHAKSSAVMDRWTPGEGITWLNHKLINTHPVILVQGGVEEEPLGQVRGGDPQPVNTNTAHTPHSSVACPP